MRIDSHQHFWRYDPVAYDWINDDMAALRRDFLPADLRPELDAAGLDGSIAVQAPQSHAENEFLLGLAAEAPWILGVVGWLDLRAPDAAAEVGRWARRERLVGIRHIAQSEPVDFLRGQEFSRGVGTLARHELTYDVLVFPPQLPAAIELVQQHPDQRFVLDHLAKPELKRGELDAWRRDITTLSAFPNVACKVSGMVTEADWQNWQPEQLHAAYEHVLERFGPDRLLYGSDWPVCLVASSYERWWATAQGWFEALSEAERTAVLGRNCRTWYPRLAKP